MACTIPSFLRSGKVVYCTASAMMLTNGSSILAGSGRLKPHQIEDLTIVGRGSRAAAHSRRAAHAIGMFMISLGFSKNPCA